MNLVTDEVAVIHTREHGDLKVPCTGSVLLARPRGEPAYDTLDRDELLQRRQQRPTVLVLVDADVAEFSKP